MSRVESRLILLLAGLVLAACGPAGQKDAWRTAGADGPEVPAAEAGYLRPPTVDRATPNPAGVLLEGTASPGAQVRLGSPGAAPILVRADSAGRWRHRLAPADGVRLFSLAMTTGDGRTVQAQGYLALLPDGRMAQLRPGTSALVAASRSDVPRLLAVDFDEDGAVTTAGVARAGSGLGLRIDRTAQASGKADGQGRFQLAVERPLGAGERLFEISGDSGEQVISLPLGRPAAPGGIYRAVAVGPHWRIDWMTPAGGLQTTLILGPAG